jgi:7,8-dihydropterin-6-yl-methyl-4-(beta-D-ribofuranosyl)aminobenzene 5'-phosphate synthase
MLICQCSAIHRRDVVCGGGAAMFSGWAPQRIDNCRRPRALQRDRSLEFCRRLFLRVLASRRPSTSPQRQKIANVDIEHFGWGIGGGKPTGKTLIRAHASSSLPEQGHCAVIALTAANECIA